MSAIINTNMESLGARRTLDRTQDDYETSVQRLSSGLRVNSAKDDASGSVIASRMESQVRGLNQAVRNASDGISLAQTAESGLNIIQGNLARMRELAIQGSNATSSRDVATLNEEFAQLNDENQRVIRNTSFNGIALLSQPIKEVFQVGANNAAGIDNIMVSTPNALSLSSASLGNSATSAQSEISKLDADIAKVASTRTLFGAIQTRFESTINQIQTASVHQAAGRGRIMDTDYAAETANMARARIQQQASTAMMAQANQSPRNVLSLLH